MDGSLVLDELCTVLAFEAAILSAIVAIRVYRRRTDVLTGPYVRRPDRPAAAKAKFDASAKSPERPAKTDARIASPEFPGQVEGNKRSAPIHLDQIHIR